MDYNVDSDLVEYIVTLTFSLMFFILGWVLPRGKTLKKIQGKVLKRFYNWTGAVMI